MMSESHKDDFYEDPNIDLVNQEKILKTLEDLVRLFDRQNKLLYDIANSLRKRK